MLTQGGNWLVAGTSSSSSVFAQDLLSLLGRSSKPKDQPSTPWDASPGHALGHLNRSVCESRRHPPGPETPTLVEYGGFNEESIPAGTPHSSTT